MIATGIAPDNESVFVPLYEPLMVATPAGAKMTVQPTNAVDVKVTPAIGTLSFMAVADGSCSFQWPFVALVVIVSVPPALSVHPPMVGGAIFRFGPATVTVPLVEKLWQTTVIAVEFMTPLNDIAVPGVSVAVTTVPTGSELDAAYPVVPVAKSNVAVPSAAASNFGSDLMKSIPPFWLTPQPVALLRGGTDLGLNAKASHDSALNAWAATEDGLTRYSRRHLIQRSRGNLAVGMFAEGRVIINLFEPKRREAEPTIVGR